jgi:DNA-binding transcriptional regulator YdaS (Cro superfamily)
MDKNPLQCAIEIVGLQQLAKACCVTYQAVQKWGRSGLPLTELSGQTTYAAAIEKATGGRVTRAQLWDWSFPERPCCYGAHSGDGGAVAVAQGVD